MTKRHQGGKKAEGKTKTGRMRKYKNQRFLRGAQKAKRKFEYFLMMYEKRKRKDIKRDKERSERNNLRNEFVIANLSLQLLSHISLETSQASNEIHLILSFEKRNSSGCHGCIQLESGSGERKTFIRFIS